MCMVLSRTSAASPIPERLYSIPKMYSVEVGTSAIDRELFRIPQRYQISRYIGRGSYGVVW